MNPALGTPGEIHVKRRNFTTVNRALSAIGRLRSCVLLRRTPTQTASQNSASLPVHKLVFCGLLMTFSATSHGDSVMSPLAHRALSARGRPRSCGPRLPDNTSTNLRQHLFCEGKRGQEGMMTSGATQKLEVGLKPTRSPRDERERQSDPLEA